MAGKNKTSLKNLKRNTSDAVNFVQLISTKEILVGCIRAK